MKISIALILYKLLSIVPLLVEGLQIIDCELLLQVTVVPLHLHVHMCLI